jgi:hypothetical protein
MEIVFEILIYKMECIDVNVQTTILVHDVNIVRNIISDNLWNKLLFELLVSDCISSPCQNGGQCVSSTINCSSTTCSASCICPNGASGIYCEQKDTSCSTISCLNGGTCLINNENNIAYCQCPSNTTGNR